MAEVYEAFVMDTLHDRYVFFAAGYSLYIFPVLPRAKEGSSGEIILHRDEVEAMIDILSKLKDKVSPLPTGEGVKNDNGKREERR